MTVNGTELLVPLEVLTMTVPAAAAAPTVSIVAVALVAELTTTVPVMLASLNIILIGAAKFVPVKVSD